MTISKYGQLLGTDGSRLQAHTSMVAALVKQIISRNGNRGIRPDLSEVAFIDAAWPPGFQSLGVPSQDSEFYRAGATFSPLFPITAFRDEWGL